MRHRRSLVSALGKALDHRRQVGGFFAPHTLDRIDENLRQLLIMLERQRVDEASVAVRLAFDEKGPIAIVQAQRVARLRPASGGNALFEPVPDVGALERARQALFNLEPGFLPRFRWFQHANVAGENVGQLALRVAQEAGAR